MLLMIGTFVLFERDLERRTEVSEKRLEIIETIWTHIKAFFNFKEMNLWLECILYLLPFGLQKTMNRIRLFRSSCCIYTYSTTRSTSSETMHAISFKIRKRDREKEFCSVHHHTAETTAQTSTEVKKGGIRSRWEILLSWEMRIKTPVFCLFSFHCPLYAAAACSLLLLIHVVCSIIFAARTKGKVKQSSKLRIRYMKKKIKIRRRKFTPNDIISSSYSEIVLLWFHLSVFHCSDRYVVRTSKAFRLWNE